MVGSTGPRRRARWLALVVLLGVTPPGTAEEGGAPTLSGSLRLDYFSSSRDLDERDDVWGATAELKLQQSLADAQQLELEARLSREDFTRDGRNRVQWISAYWFARGERVDWRIGQQKVRWGKADGINPTDFFTPIDYAVLLPLEADRYLSVPAVRADVQIDDASSLSLVAEPDFTPSVLPWPRPSPVVLVDDEPSGRHPPQAGARWLHTGENLDWSISVFNGFSTLPVLSFLDVAPDGRPRYRRHYPAIDGIGMDVARNFGQWGFRAELAYTNVDDGSVAQTVASNYFLVAGVDRGFGDWSLNVQGLWRHTPDFEQTLAAANAAEQFAATQNAIVYNQQARTMRGMSARIAANWLHETLQTELLTIGFFDPDNYLLRPLVTYAWSDTRKLRIGGEYYSGPEASFFGPLRRNRTGFIEFQQFF
jgi:hypothetical protein